MENNVFTERLTEFGLTRQEACIYECLLMEGKTTGYEVAKKIGISRSNAYASLASMTEKGRPIWWKKEAQGNMCRFLWMSSAATASGGWKGPPNG